MNKRKLFISKEMKRQKPHLWAAKETKTNKKANTLPK
jgi:hypothetical protein